ncbi:High affinity sulfate transporter 2 [Morella rubra]|uniref:High affinity sulfate transporter 2 n=1 Tax=Morella rubra TaxID=262757 RepID=A0A6A1V2T8_9ROSI|nr:High affinity sulfate transporter 2 [Morella rubra]
MSRHCVSDELGEHSMEINRVSSSHRHAETMPYIQRVGMPPKQTLWEQFFGTVNETFFSDDPYRSFRNQPRSRKFYLGLQAVFPILEWAKGYNLTKFKGDLISGLTIASLAIPQDIGYAKLAHLPAENGLYSSFVPPLIYSVLGSSRDIAIGPVAVVSILLGNRLSSEINPSTDAIEYRHLAFTATFFAGLTQFLLGFFRLGFLIDFLSHAAIIGFMAGAAITIGLQQLKGLLGISNFTTKTDIVNVMHSVFRSAHHGGKKNNKLFWVPAIAPLISTILSTSIVYITRADKHGVQIEAIAIGRTFASMKDYHVDGNREMVAIGAMNMAGSLTSCYVATGSFSRSAVNFMAGCNTAVSNIVMSCVVLLTLLVITPLFKYTPNAVLAAIIISAVLGLIDIDAALHIWKVDKLDFIACMGAFFGVVFDSVEIGLLIAVCISLAKILLQVTRPRTAVLGKLPMTNVYRNTLQYPEAAKVPGVLLVTVDSAIYFSNCNYVRERILRWLTDEEEEIMKGENLKRIQNLIVEMSPVTDIDTGGILALEDLYRALQKKEVQLALANPGPLVIQKLLDSDFVSLIGEDQIFLSVADAIQACTAAAQQLP